MRGLIALIVCLALPATSLAVGPPPIPLDTGKAAAKVAFAQVQKKTKHSTASGVSRCTQPSAAVVDCKGWVRITHKRTCRLRVQVRESSEGPVWKFVGPSTCKKRRLSSAPTIY